MQVHEKPTATLAARVLAAARRPENARCADCDASEPRWATVTHGGFICTQCAGAHRSLGVHVSFVLSTTLDAWTRQQVEAIEAAGNATLNATLERRLGAQPKPSAAASRAERERFIRAKYEVRQFASTPTSTAAPAPAPAPAPATPRPALASRHGMVEFVGVLEVSLLAATGLAATGVTGLAETYVALRLGEQRVRSRRAGRSASPQWSGETLRLSWDGVAPLAVELLAAHRVQSDRRLGVREVSLQPLLTAPGSAMDEWFPLAAPREWAANAGEHLLAGAEGVGRGFYRGITGVWTDPIRGAKNRGLGGFAKGVGVGLVGAVYRPIKGLGVMARHTGQSIGLGRSPEDRREALVPAGSVHMVLSLQTFV